MRKFHAFAVLGIVVLALAMQPGSAGAQVDPLLSTIPPVITIAPGPLFAGNPIGTYRVNVEEAGGSAVQGATVTLTFTAAAIPLIAWCGGVPPAPLVASTDMNGDVTFVLPEGSGCLDSPPCATPVATVQVDGPVGVGGTFTVDIDRINSPDVVDDAGVMASCPSKNNCVGGMTAVSLVDAVYHTRPIKLGLVDPCTKFTPPFNAAVGVIDAVYLTPFIKTGNTCTCTP